MRRLYHCIAPAVTRLYSRNIPTNSIARLGCRIVMAPKRKRSSLAAVNSEIPLPPPLSSTLPSKRRAPGRTNSKSVTNPDVNSQVLDGPNAARASPDSDVNEDFPLNFPAEPAKKKRAIAGKKTGDASKSKVGPKSAVAKDELGVEGLGNPEAEGDEVADEEELVEALSRPPPINSDYLPLPWKGRLGYVRLS
jgi:UV DNA damage endonuclease